MSEEVKDFESWEEVIINFFEKKKIIDELKYLKDEIKKVNTQYSQESYFHNEVLENFFDAKKNKKPKEQTDIEFQRDKALKIIRLQQKPEGLNFFECIKKYRSKFQKINEKYEPKIWLSESSKNASSVSFATHVSKLTHSKIDSPSLYDQINVKKPNLLTTSCLNKKIIDGAVSGNQFAPIFQFLELEFKGEKLATQFSNRNNTILECISENNEQLSQWNIAFNLALSAKEKSSHFLAKQIYFPTNSVDILQENSYHLLCHLKSSSLAHAIYENIFDDSQKEPRKLKGKHKFSTVEIFSFLNKAKLSVTASNHSNASQLNGKRGGKIFLFSTQAPTWQSQLKAPIYKKSLFDYFGNSHITEDVNYLRDFLLRFENIGLSIKNPQRYKHLERWISSIIDEVLFYTNSIQTMPADWSNTKEIKLKVEHQYFLDPYRDNKDFQNKRESTDWQSVVRNDFARWLNQKLIGKDKKFTPQAEHTRLWKKVLETPLREDCEAIKSEAKYSQQKEKV